MADVGLVYDKLLNELAAFQAALADYTNHARANKLCGPHESPDVPWGQDLRTDRLSLLKELFRASFDRDNIANPRLAEYVLDRREEGRAERRGEPLLSAFPPIRH